MKFCIIQLVYQFIEVKHMIYVSDLMPKLNTVCIVYIDYIVQILALYIVHRTTIATTYSVRGEIPTGV